MKRREFLKNAGLGAAAGAGLVTAVQARAQQTGGLPSIQWRMAASWPKSLDTLYGGAELICKRVAAATGGKFNIKLFAAGEIVGGLQVLDAVQNGTVECGHTAAYYYFGKDQTFAFGTAIPFGLNARQQYAWYYHAGGLELMREFYKEYNVVNILAGNTGAQMGGWFRKPIKSVADLKGLKFRIGGTGGTVLTRLGVVPQQIAGGDIYPALEKGTIDAAEWVGPYDDEKLGFHKVAKFYYTPGVMELEAVNQLFIHKAAWAALPPAYQAALRYACWYAATEMVASYDAKNALAINRVIAGGAQLSVLPPEIIKALRTALETVLDEEGAKSSRFKKILDNWRQF